MGRVCVLAVVCVAAAVAAAVALAGSQQPSGKGILFTKASAGKLPAGWTIEKTGKGDAGTWKVVADATGPARQRFVLAQTSASPKTIFNLCVLDKTSFHSFKNVEVYVEFKAVKGEMDQGGGIVWRYQDANNYYVARMNPLEDNYRLYKVVGGSRKQLATKEGLKVETGTWHALKIRHVGEKIECFLDGKKYLEHTDGEFDKAGQVGLWTKADAQTYFDDLKIRNLQK